MEGRLGVRMVDNTRKVVFSATLFSTNRIISAGEIRDAGSADSVFLNLDPSSVTVRMI